MKTGIVICSRLQSNRLPGKALRKINGVPLLEHLLKRCFKTELPVYVAVPNAEYEDYRYLKELYKDNNFRLFTGTSSDPLARTAECAKWAELDNVIRVTHDKIFIEPVAVKILLDTHIKEDLDYTVATEFVNGASFEVISTRAINKASQEFKDVEYITYAVQCVTNKIKRVDLSSIWSSDHRFLVDYPEDLKMLELLLHSLGNDCSLSDAIAFLNQHNWISKINRNPKVTVYTCAYNAEKWITKAMGSVAKQYNFNRCEYLLIDDCSQDKTPFLMSKFCSSFKNARWIRNELNKGLASSSNIALTQARGKYIVRLDADDYFHDEDSIERLVNEAENTNADIVYPDNYFGDFKTIQKGNEKHHVGGSLFRTRAANHVKFTDGLRGYEGLDFFVRAKDQLKISYLNKPIFFYRQHDKSMSKTNLEDRSKLYEAIRNKPTAHKAG